MFLRIKTGGALLVAIPSQIRRSCRLLEPYTNSAYQGLSQCIKRVAIHRAFIFIICKELNKKGSKLALWRVVSQYTGAVSHSTSLSQLPAVTMLCQLSMQTNSKKQKTSTGPGIRILDTPKAAIQGQLMHLSLRGFTSRQPLLSLHRRSTILYSLFRAGVYRIILYKPLTEVVR